MNGRAQRLFTFEKAAELMAVSKPKIRAWVQNGTIRTVYRLGHRTVRIPESEIARLQREAAIRTRAANA